MEALTQHAGDCTIYRALINGRAFDGVCTCGYGWSLVSMGNHSEMLSKEREEDENKLEIAKKALQGVINSAAHPDIALRAVMVDLKPVRAALKKL